MKSSAPIDRQFLAVGRKGGIRRKPVIAATRERTLNVPRRRFVVGRPKGDTPAHANGQSLAVGREIHPPRMEVLRASEPAPRGSFMQLDGRRPRGYHTLAVGRESE